jgi:hypothetical protein
MWPVFMMSGYSYPSSVAGSFEPEFKPVIDQSTFAQTFEFYDKSVH